ncbi:MAG TPA: aconitase X [Candidatus Sulfomarinibacteraceae bacterium]|nr:aconitase X [Candidatus Sulfomarinibacteraceae bacterium]
MTDAIQLNDDQRAMLRGDQGRARQMAMRLVLDLAAAAGATELIPIQSAHLSGVSPLTGGLGLRQFLTRLAEDRNAQVALPTTLNAAGCDAARFEAMRISVPHFLEHSQEIVARYEALGVQPTQSCIPYEWDGVITEGAAAWSESNAICFGNSYCGLLTNRESGLSALASALTGYAPRYGLLHEDQRRPNLHVQVTVALEEPTDFSILGDWIGKQVRPEWQLPYGPIPLIAGLPAEIEHDQKKALSAAAANYGCPLLYLEGEGEYPDPHFEGRLTFDDAALATRYDELQPRQPVSLITLGCPQASVGELRAAAQHLKGRRVRHEPAGPGDPPPLWIFTSRANRAIAERTGLARIIEESGALLLENTCPEVVPYDQRWVRHILTNSMKAEHYIKSGLNGIPTSVMTLPDCIAVANGDLSVAEAERDANRTETAICSTPQQETAPAPLERASGPFEASGRGLPSQDDFEISGEAFVTHRPITLLGFVNRETGVIEEPGHPADGESLAGKIAIFPKGTGSTVAPYVLLELFYRGKAPLAIVNTDIDQQSAPACSLENIPYAYDFDEDIIAGINHGDVVTLARRDDRVILQVVQRSGGE